MLSAWLAHRRSRRASRKLMRRLLARVRRHVAFEKKMREFWIDFCNTDFAAIWAACAATLGKDVESLTTEEKQHAHLDYLLREPERRSAMIARFARALDWLDDKLFGFCDAIVCWLMGR